MESVYFFIEEHMKDATDVYKKFFEKFLTDF